MKERIIEFLKKENKSSAQFAEEIGVQPSGISHILSGRNNPSLDFVIKMLEKYPFISTDWLIFGKGSMYKETGMADLFSNVDLNTEEITKRKDNNKGKEVSLETGQLHGIQDVDSQMPEKQRKIVKKIVWFYESGSFEEFYPMNG